MAIRSINLEDFAVFKNNKTDYKSLQKELTKAHPYLHLSWGGKQNDFYDKLTRFIYYIKTFDEIMIEYNKLQKSHPNVPLGYVIQRWYNHLCSTTAEEIVCSYTIAEKEKNKFDKKKDLFILDVPFDLKLSVMPKRLFKYNFEYFKKRHTRNELIEWLYMEQSKEGRYHLENRLFIVCRGENCKDNNFESKKLKCRFDLIEKQVELYLLYLMKKKESGTSEVFNKIQLLIDGQIKEPFSDVIMITTQ